MAVKNWLPKPVDGANGKMEEPLKAVDIRDTLNAYGGKTDNKTNSFFSDEANINRWSKHKPIVTGFVNDYFTKFQDIRNSVDIWSNQQGSAPTVYVGLTPETNQTALAEVWNGCSEDSWFTYIPPKGGTDEPLRMGDFRGYRADATSPFKSFSSDSTSIGGENATVNFTLNMRYYLSNELDTVEGGMLSLKDMQVFDDNEVYTMVIIRKYNNYYYYHEGDSINTASWGELTTAINFGTINNTNQGTYECAVALRDSTGLFYVLPFTPITINADIVYYNDSVEISHGSAAYSGTNSGAVTLFVTVHAGIQTSQGTWTESLYIAGENDSAMTGPFGHGTLSLEKGESGTLRIEIKAGDTNWSSVLSILQNNSAVWLNYNNTLDGAILVNVG